jgi:Protein of unknown function (DUF3253)
MTTDPAEQAILQLLSATGAGKSISPSDAARALAGNPPGDAWRRSLAPIRLASMRLARAGRIEILRKGKPVAPEDAHGVIRLRLASDPAVSNMKVTL